MAHAARRRRISWRRGKIKAAIIIPKGFMRQIEAGEEAQLQLLLDGTDNNSAPIVEGVAQRVIQRYNAERADQGACGRAGCGRTAAAGSSSPSTSRRRSATTPGSST